MENIFDTGREEDVSGVTCEICIEPVSAAKRFKNNKCGHHSYCLDCIEKYIQLKIEGDGESEIKCPSSECNELLDPLACRSNLPPNLFVKWGDVLCESAVSRYTKVYCPFLNCSCLILNECGGKVTRTRCPKCKQNLCFECRVPWHAGSRCNERGNDILLRELMDKEKWKRCPACRHGVELGSGCPRVTCRCGASFCYKCERTECQCKRPAAEGCNQPSSVTYNGPEAERCDQPSYAATCGTTVFIFLCGFILWFTLLGDRIRN